MELYYIFFLYLSPQTSEGVYLREEAPAAVSKNSQAWISRAPLNSNKRRDKRSCHTAATLTTAGSLRPRDSGRPSYREQLNKRTEEERRRRDPEFSHVTETNTRQDATYFVGWLRFGDRAAVIASHLFLQQTDQNDEHIQQSI